MDQLQVDKWEGIILHHWKEKGKTLLSCLPREAVLMISNREQ